MKTRFFALFVAAVLFFPAFAFAKPLAEGDRYVGSNPLGNNEYCAIKLVRAHNAIFTSTKTVDIEIALGKDQPIVRHLYGLKGQTHFADSYSTDLGEFYGTDLIGQAEMDFDVNESADTATLEVKIWGSKTSAFGSGWSQLKKPVEKIACQMSLVNTGDSDVHASSAVNKPETQVTGTTGEVTGAGANSAR